MSSNPATALPLTGIRVIDLTVVWAGTFGTALLADLGAEVIKVENMHVWQPMTRGGQARPSAEMVKAGAGWAVGYPNAEPGPRPWNYAPTFVQQFRNKHSMTVDLVSDEGREIFARLVSKSDALVENNASGTLEKLGIGPDFLRRAREDLVALRMPAYGSDGPYRFARALGVHLESVMGHTLLRGYPDLDPSYITSIFSGDYVAGAHAAFAIMAALRRRRNTGHGQFIELAQAECAGGMLAQAFMDYSFNGVVQERIGNRSVNGHAPYNLYPARSGGDSSEGSDRWVSISVMDDDQWHRLREAMGDPEWARDPGLRHEAGRLERHEELDARIGRWTSSQDDYELMHLLQSHGVPAAPVLDSSRIHDDVHVRHRQLNETLDLFDDIGSFRYNRPFMRFSETPLGIRKPPVALGEDNDYVYREVLGYSDSEINGFIDRGHIGMDYDPDIP